MITKYSTRIFLLGIISACLGVLLFGSYILYRQSKVDVDYWDVSIIHHLQKPMVVAPMLICALVIGLSIWCWKLASEKQKRAIPLMMAFWCGTLAALVIGLVMIKRIEGVYFLKSPYFKKFIMGAIPVTVCLLFGIVGIRALWKETKPKQASIDI